MDKSQSSFGDELKLINDEVSVDVSQILKLAKASQKPKPFAVEKETSGNQASDTRRSPPQIKSKPKPEPLGTTPIITHQHRVNVTTRLSNRLNELLTEAVLRQKLSKQQPDTRQDIIEVAVTEWMNRNGHQS